MGRDGEGWVNMGGVLAMSGRTWCVLCIVQQPLKRRGEGLMSLGSRLVDLALLAERDPNQAEFRTEV